MKIKALSKRDLLFNIFCYMILTIGVLTILYPFYFICIASISDPIDVLNGKTIILPGRLVIDGFRCLFTDKMIYIGYKNTLIYTLIATAISLLLTMPAGFALSRKEMKGRNLIMYIITFTMLFNGGMIPTYILVYKLGMLNTIWSLVLPNAVWVWLLIVGRTFFQQSIPEELLEASRMDGCSYIKHFLLIVLPLSKALIVIMILFYGVDTWNSYFQALLYLSDQKRFPLQLMLRDILLNVQSSITFPMVEDAITADKKFRLVEAIKYSSVIVVNMPILIIYPFLQKYFVQGIMIGAVKG